MKSFPFLRFVPKPLRLTRLFQRTPVPKPDPAAAREKERDRESGRYIPIFTGGQVPLFMLKTENPRRRRDIYDET